jgi:hypothetical protein
LIGASRPAADQQLRAALTRTVAGWSFDLARWEVNAIYEKAVAWQAAQRNGVPDAESPTIVLDYLDRAYKIGRTQAEIDYLMSGGTEETDDLSGLQGELNVLRDQQEEIRGQVEQVISRQIGSELEKSGLVLFNRPFPPVQFSFTEPPLKMVVSPRDRIETIFQRMLAPEIDAATIEQSERAIFDKENLSAYITQIGGLGAFPTMVVDQASLGWILSTVAHEWTHNYLTIFPLGLNYLTSADMTTINETVAEIVGDEIGERALRTFYPEMVVTEPPRRETMADLYVRRNLPVRFNFRDEMRETRLEVDRLLAAGKVEEAEAYMEARRLLFVEQGYGLRILNQAYFAFHGSYGKGAASTSPIGPKLEHLRTLTPDISTFLHTVRSITSPEQLDDTVTDWEGRQ